MRTAKRNGKGAGEAAPGTAARGGTPAPAPERPILVVTGSVGRSTPAPGGWGYVICYPTGQETEAGGMAAETTGARMALTAVIRALERVSAGEIGTAGVRVVTSSQHTVDGASGKAERRAHLDLWAQLDDLARGRRIVWEWEPDETMYLQERATELAQLAMKRGH
jgi:ribonuclease HI